MSHELFWETLDKFKRPTRLMEFTPRDPGQVPVTKVGGVPWWPAGVERPRCPQGHAMSFIAQIRLDEVPDIGIDEPVLLSFHYCMECTYEGNMSWGYGWTNCWDKDPIVNEGYNLTLFDQFESHDLDGIGTVGEEIVDPSIVLLRDSPDFPETFEIESIPDLAPLYRKAGFDHYESDARAEWEAKRYEENAPFADHIESKLGGWPCWQQYPEWPVQPDGTRMSFIGQLEGASLGSVPWETGSLYLFLDKLPDGTLSSTFVIQTT